MPAWLTFTHPAALLRPTDPHAAPTRTSQRLQRRAIQAYQGHLPMDNEFVTFDPSEEPAPPPRAGAARRQRPAGTGGQQQTGQQQGGAPLSGAAGNGPASGAGAPRRGGAAAAAAATPFAAAGRASSGRRAASGAGQRSRPSSRQSSGDLKGRPSFAELVESGFMRVRAVEEWCCLCRVGGELLPL